MSEQENKSSESSAFVWVLIVALIGFVAWLVIPNFIKAHQSYAANPCINNLRQIDAAKNEWALEAGKTNGTIARENDIKPYIKLDSKGNFPKCPDGGTYTIAKVGENPTCSLGTTVTPAHVLP